MATIGKTTTLSVTGSAWAAITTHVNTPHVTVREDPSVSGWPTTAFLVAMPTSSDTAIEVPIGQQFLFPAPNNTFIPASFTVGYIMLPSAGSTTFQQVES